MQAFKQDQNLQIQTYRQDKLEFSLIPKKNSQEYYFQREYGTHIDFEPLVLEKEMQHLKVKMGTVDALLIKLHTNDYLELMDAQHHPLKIITYKRPSSDVSQYVMDGQWAQVSSEECTLTIDGDLIFDKGQSAQPLVNIGPKAWKVSKPPRKEYILIPKDQSTLLRIEGSSDGLLLRYLWVKVKHLD